MGSNSLRDYQISVENSLPKNRYFVVEGGPPTSNSFIRSKNCPCISPHTTKKTKLEFFNFLIWGLA